MLKKSLITLGALVAVLGIGTGIAHANNQHQPESWPPCQDIIPWTEACYVITSVNDFPPSIRFGHATPFIAWQYVEVPAQAGENLLSNASYVYHFEIDPNTIPECPNGGYDEVGVLGNYGNNGFSLYPSGIGIEKIQCY